MARVAVVTGGSRGIGHAISVELKNKGYRVAANYAGNDAAAQKFQAETGIPVYKWDVGNYDACQENLARIEKDLGPIDVLVNNAGITRDGMHLRGAECESVALTHGLVDAGNARRFAPRPDDRAAGLVLQRNITSGVVSVMMGVEYMGQFPAFGGQGLTHRRSVRRIDGGCQSSVRVVNEHAVVVAEAGELVDLKVSHGIRLGHDWVAIKRNHRGC